MYLFQTNLKILLIIHKFLLMTGEISLNYFSVLIIAILTLTFLPTTFSIECEPTHLEFFSNYSLGKRDQLNRTFAKVAERAYILQNVTYEEGGRSYKISNIKPKYFYIDSKQSAFINGQYIIISGGRLQVTMDFTWSKSNGQGGSGVAVAESDDIFFAKFYKVQGGFLVEEVYAYDPIIFAQRKSRITRIDPPSISQQDFIVLQGMFNPIPKAVSVSSELAAEIDKSYFYFLNQSLYDDRRNVQEHFQYDWKNPHNTGKDINITYSINMTDSDIEEGGVTTFYKMNIPTYDKWQCTVPSPKMPLNPSVYGGVQQFVSMDVYINTIKYAIENQVLDTQLNKRAWESRFFQFFVGDLYEVIPKLAEKHYASEVVTGNCLASPQNLNITKGNHTHLNVTIQYNCELLVGNDKISVFRINLLSMVEGIPRTKDLEFRVIDYVYNVTFTDYMQFKIENKELAEHMVMHSLHRLRETPVFGTGWPLYDRDYPHFIVEQNYTIVYDSTHVDPDQFQMSQKLEAYIAELEEKMKSQ